MYCPNCGVRLAKSECRRTMLDELSLGGVNRDAELTVCSCDHCDSRYGVIKISQAAEDSGAW
jgi:hypothetical protein